MQPMTPANALAILVSLLGRLSLSPVEHAGAQVAIDALAGAVTPKPVAPVEAPKPETISPE